jgi:hypothetical protein
VANTREQIQDARENPIQAATKSNVENLLDLDMSAAADESVKSPTVPNHTTSNILDDLGSLSLSSTSAPPQVTSSAPPSGYMSSQPPSGVMSPISQVTSPPVTAQNTNMNDLLGLFGASNQGNGFGANVWSDAPQSNGAQPNKSKSNEDILGLF